jgi:hypothetical protein
VQEAFNENPLYAWGALGIAAIDSEGICGYGSYARHIEYLAEVSNGAFNPKALQDVHVEGWRFRISFELGGNFYEYVTRDCGDYLDDEVFDLINRALREAGEERQFLDTPVTDQVFYFVLVTPQTYRNAERLRVIPPSLYFEYRERTPHKVDHYLCEYYRELEG